MRRSLLIFSLTLVILPVMLWLAMPWYAPLLVDRILTGSGWRVLQLDMQRPFWRSLGLPSVAIQDETGNQVVLSGVVVQRSNGFDMLDIQVREAKIHLRDRTDRNANDEYTSDKISTFLPESLLEGIPGLTLSIDQLFLYRNGTAEPLMRVNQVQLEGSAARIGFRSMIRVDTLTSAIYQLDASITPENQLRMQLTNTAFPQPLLQFEAVISKGERLFAQASLEADIAQWNSFPFLSRDTTLAGGLRVTFSVDMSDIPLSDFMTTPDVVINGKLEMDITLPEYAADLALEAQVALSVENQQWRLALQPLDTTDVLLRAQQVRQNQQHQLEITLPEAISWEGDISDVTTVTALNGGAEAAVEAEYAVNGVQVAKVNVSKLHVKAPASEAFQWGLYSFLQVDMDEALNVIDSELHNNALDGYGNKLTEAVLTLPVTIALGVSDVQFRIEEGAKLAAAALAIDGSRFKTPQLVLPPQTVNIDYASPGEGSLDFFFTASELTAYGYRASPIRITGHANGGQERVSVHLVTDAFALDDGSKGQAFRLSSYGFFAEVNLPPGDLTNRSPDIKFVVKNQCEEVLIEGAIQQARYLHWQSQRKFMQTNTLANWLDMPQLTSDIIGGTLMLVSDWDLQNETWPQVNMRLRGGEVKGDLGEFNGVQVALSTQQAESKRHYPLAGNIASMNVGVDVSDMSFDLDLIPLEDGMAADIRRVHGTLFGGRVWIEDEYWVLGGDELIDVHIEELDLAEVIGTQSIQGLATTGSLSGVQPVKFTADGSVELAKGTLINTDAGIIRYHNALSGSESMNQQLKFTMDVLENFQYEKLETQTEYHDGNLLLHSKIVGNNPDVAEGRKIELNLSTEVGLLSALQAMRLQAGLEAQVEKLFSPDASVTDKAYCHQIP